MIAVILDAAPEEYHAVLTLEQRLRGDKLTLNDLETAMNQFWRQGKTPKTNDGNYAAEISLSAFGGVCYNCKKKGHKANKCPDKEHKDGEGTRLKEMVISSMENVTTVEKLGTKKQIVVRRKKINIKGQRVLSPEVQKLQHRQLIMDQELNFYCVE